MIKDKQMKKILFLLLMANPISYIKCADLSIHELEEKKESGSKAYEDI